MILIINSEDGFIRTWDYETIDNADVNEEAAKEGQVQSSSRSAIRAKIFELDPLDEIFVGKDIKIINMIKCPETTNDYILQDQNGYYIKVNTKRRSSDKFVSFHAGPVAGVDTSPLLHAMASLGSDGSLKLYEYTTKTKVAEVFHNSGGSFLSYLPEVLDAKGVTLAAGFKDGVVRIFGHSYISPGTTEADFLLHHVFKPHKKAITAISFSQDGSLMATGSEDQTIFFFRIKSQFTNHDGNPVINFSKQSVNIVPIGFIHLDSPIQTILFSPDNHENVEEFENSDRFNNFFTIKNDSGRQILILTKNGVLQSAIVPNEGAFDNSVTFELPINSVNLTKWHLQVPEKVIPNENEIVAKESNSAEANNNQETGNSDENKENNPDNKPTIKLEDLSEDELTEYNRKTHGLVVQNDSLITSILYLEGGYVLATFINADGDAELRSIKLSDPTQSKYVLSLYSF